MGDALEQLSFRVAILRNTNLSHNSIPCTGAPINSTSSTGSSTTRHRSNSPSTHNLNNRVSRATVQVRF